MPTSIALLKHHADGSADERFGAGGLAVLDFGLPRDADVYIGSLAADSAERLVVGGSIDGQLAVARVLPNGRPDVTFGQRGLARFNFYSSSSEIGGHVAVDDADRVYVAGTARRGQREEIALARLERDGCLDRSFGGDGKVLTRFGSVDGVAANALTLDRLQRPIVAGVAHRRHGSFLALARYQPSGALDRSFDGDGRVLTGYRSARKELAFGVATDDGCCVVSCGTTGGNTPNVIVTRHRGDGLLDRSFGGDGKVVTEIHASREERATAVAVDDRGRIVVAGYARLLSSHTTDEHGADRIAAVLVARYLPIGALDPAFSRDGRRWSATPSTTAAARRSHCRCTARSTSARSGGRRQRQPIRNHRFDSGTHASSSCAAPTSAAPTPSSAAAGSSSSGRGTSPCDRTGTDSSRSAAATR